MASEPSDLMARTCIKTEAGHVFLDIKQITAKVAIPPHAFARMERAELTGFLEAETKKLILQLAARIPGKVFDHKEHYYPADWWQAFKERWLKSAVSKRVFGPVRYTLVTMTAEATYPSIHVPNHNPFVQVTMKKQ